MPPDSKTARGILAERLQSQAAWCDDLGSPLYGSLLRSAADDLNVEGAVWGVLTGFENEDGHAALALRLMGAVHRLVLMGKVPDLALHYPSAGGDDDAGGAGPAFLAALVDNKSEIRELLPRGCQTNEVGRSAALLGGFLEVAHRTHNRLRILELGASAGFNLRWDRYRYDSSAGGWGHLDSPVRFSHSFEVAPPLDRRVDVVGRFDPDVSEATALLQVHRIAEARILDESKLRALVERFLQGRILWIFGEPYVNVLQLNLALDAGGAG